jgi:molybdopterin biosynthesis enzyme
MNPPAETSQRIARLAPLNDILAHADALGKPVAPRRVALDQALGAILAADVIAPARVPGRAVALVDGWAVRADRVADAGPHSAVALSPAPAWVEVGDAMPADADAVLPPDAITAHGNLFEAMAAAAPGDGVLAAGAHVEKGTVCRAGRRLRATDLAAIAALGIENVEVRRPKVQIAITDPKLGHGVVGELLVHAVAAAGGIAHVETSAPLERALLGGGTDAVFMVGGSGQGRRDTSVSTLARVGRVACHGLGIAPGETAALGDAGGRPILVVPGRLDAALGAWLLVGAPLVARLAGATAQERGEPVRLARKIASQVGIAEVVLVRRTKDGVEPLASPPFGLAALAAADGWVLVPPASEGFAPGASVELRILP